MIHSSLYSNVSSARYRKLESYQKHAGAGIMKVLKPGENAKLKRNAADGVVLVNQVIITPVSYTHLTLPTKRIV